MALIGFSQLLGNDADPDAVTSGVNVASQIRIEPTADNRAAFERGNAAVQIILGRLHNDFTAPLEWLQQRAQDALVRSEIEAHNNTAPNCQVNLLSDGSMSFMPGAANTSQYRQSA